MKSAHDAPHNNLLATLPEKDRQHFLERCELIDLVFCEVLSEKGGLLSHAYFPTDSFISMISDIGTQGRLEVGLIGSEGMLGASLTLGIQNTPLYTIVQGAGPAWRMEAAAFQHQIEKHPALAKIIQRYFYVELAQLVQTVACSRFHQVEARLARWLLMTQDRAHADKFHVTQAFLAYMLGVRRVSVTKAASALQAQNLISYRRGQILILDLQGLQARACSCYDADKALYSQIIS